MSTGTVHSLTPTRYWFTWAPNDPALHVQPGDTVVAPTRDARGGDEHGEPIPAYQKQRSSVTEIREGNPLVGPIYVEGAEVGDILTVHIERIALTRPSAWSRQGGRFGSFTGEGPGKELLLNEPVPDIDFHWQFDRERMVGTLELSRSALGRVDIPLHPFIGSIGVAPAYGRAEIALTPGEYGGNMDCVETKEGTTLYLPVWVRGAYLAFGDVHAAQGDGELCGAALETSAEVTVRLEVIKGRRIEWPRLEDATHIMTVGNTRPLDDCVRLANMEMVKWLVADHGYDRWEAFQVLSQVGTMRVGNFCDPNYTVVAKFPKKYLPGAKA